MPQALGSPFSGLLSDRLGRRPMIVFSLGSVGILGFAAALAPSFAALCAIRFAAGLLGSLAPTSLMAAVGDLFPAGRRARAMGWFNMGFSFAAIGGVPIVAAIGGTLGWRWAFSIIGLVLLALAACMAALVPAHSSHGGGHECARHVSGGVGRARPPGAPRREPDGAVAVHRW